VFLFNHHIRSIKFTEILQVIIFENRLSWFDLILTVLIMLIHSDFDNRPTWRFYYLLFKDHLAHRLISLSAFTHRDNKIYSFKQFGLYLFFWWNHIGKQFNLYFFILTLNCWDFVWWLWNLRVVGIECTFVLDPI